MDALLPVKRERQGTAEAAYYTYSWQGSLKCSLQTLARGVFASHVASGEALFHCIRDMQIRSGFPHPIKLARHTVHGLALFFDKLLSPADVQIFFTSTLPQIARLALNLPILLQSQSLHLVADLKAAVAAVDPSPPDTTLLLRLLRTQQAGMVLLRQELVASLLACSFLCLFPTEHRREEQLGRINFDKLFAGVYERGGKKKNENKLRCLLHYFDRVCNSMPQGTVSFERKVLPKEAINDAIWGSSGAPLCPITVLQEGCIEDDGRDCLQVDFANRLLGGGALGDGCVQEEIRFMINPELIAGMLFMPAMADNESIEIVGAERYSTHEGYGPTFCFKGDFHDLTLQDTWGRRQTRIIAMDALDLPGENQFCSMPMLRELKKAYCGFLETSSMKGGQVAAVGGGGGGGQKSSVSQRHKKNQEHLSQAIFEASIAVALANSVSDLNSRMCTLAATESWRSLQPEGSSSQSVDVMEVMAESPDESPGCGTGTSTSMRRIVGIATGNWGCGVFGGNLELKSLLQWLAASQAGRPYVLYFSFKNPQAKRLQEVADWILQERWCVGELWSILLEYGKQSQFHVNLFDWIMPQPGTQLCSSQHYHKAG
ncbi:unnamed protein product [Sphagnum jensenii]|uniref:poly(ADP-ribose) glycohydrolase n=1 Tax=Sphagnum jensenii TaxID=128206 RepID=A0ABP0VKI5_9BRYO